MSESDAQNAINEIAAKVGQQDSIDPAFHSQKLQEVWDNPKSSAVEIVYQDNVAFMQTPPALVVPSIVDTGVDIDGLPSGTQLTITFIFDGGGTTYAISTTDRASGLVAGADIRQIRTGEPETVGGDVTMIYWYDSATNQVRAQLDFDGSGKTPVMLRLIISNVSVQTP